MKQSRENGPHQEKQVSVLLLILIHFVRYLVLNLLNFVILFQGFNKRVKIELNADEEGACLSLNTPSINQSDSRVKVKALAYFIFEDFSLPMRRVPLYCFVKYQF